MYRQNNQPVVKAKNTEKKQVPDVKGMGLKDAVFFIGIREYIRVAARGTEK